MKLYEISIPDVPKQKLKALEDFLTKNNIKYEVWEEDDKDIREIIREKLGDN